VSRELEAPVFGHIPVLQAKHDCWWRNSAIDKMIVTHHHSKSSQAEAFRTVRTAMIIAAKQEHRIIQLASPDPGDGKTTTAANLAVVIAKAGKKCLLVDCDLRRSRIHKCFGLKNVDGVTSMILDGVDFPDVTHEDVIPNLDVICSGPRVDDPAELFHTPRFAEFIESVRERYDFVLIDSPPLLAVSDSSMISGFVDGVLMVLRISRHNRTTVRRAKESLELVGAKVEGVVVNAVDTKSGYGNYYGAYGYGSGYYYRSYSYDSDAELRTTAPAVPAARPSAAQTPAQN
jgi:capsular exopolysaccharide synthesis family protein